MSDIEQGKGIELTDPNDEQHVEAVAQTIKEEAIGSTALTGARTTEPITALDEQAPRSWDLHKSGW